MQNKDINIHCSENEENRVFNIKDIIHRKVKYGNTEERTSNW